jgi:hypothetical protein
MKPLRISAAVIGLSVLLLLEGCTSYSGPAIRKAAAAGPSSAIESSYQQQHFEEADQGVRIVTIPTGARIKVDGKVKGNSPLLLDLPTGNYLIEAEKSGYRRASISLSHIGDEYTKVELSLKAIEGSLLIETTPQDAEIHSGWKTFTPGKEERLGVGSYELEIGAFGYETKRKTVAIEEGRLSRISIDLVPVPFVFEQISVTRKRFDPTDPGTYGSVIASVTVSAPGDGSMIIVGQGGEIVAGPFPVRFTRSLNRIVWDGRDTKGQITKEGEYRLVITAMQGDLPLSVETPIAVDRSIDLRSRPVYNGAAGTLFCPLPASLPQGSLQAGMLFLAHAGGSDYQIPAVASLRYARKKGEEIVISGGMIARNPGSDIPFGSLSWSKTLFQGEGNVVPEAAALVKGGYFHNSSIDPCTNFTGISLSLPFSLSLSPIRVALAPELMVSTERIGDEEEESEGRVTAWAYGRGAILLDAGPFSLAFSTAIRSKSLEKGVAAAWPISSGLELHWLLPNSITTISLASGIEWNPESGEWDYSAGGGIWIIP